MTHLKTAKNAEFYMGKKSRKNYINIFAGLFYIAFDEKKIVPSLFLTKTVISLSPNTMELSYFPCWTMLKSFIPWIKVLNRLLKTALWLKKHPTPTEFCYFQKILIFCTFWSFRILYTMLFRCILLSNAWHRFICKQIEIWLTLGVPLGYSDVFESCFDRLH